MPTTLEKSFISLSSIPSGPYAWFALSDLNDLIFYLPQKLEVSQNSKNLVKHFLLWLQY